jgi:hypothetical protein
LIGTRTRPSRAARSEVVGDSQCGVRIDRERVDVIGSVERRDRSAMPITAFDRASGGEDLVDRAGVRGLPLEAMLSPRPQLLAIVREDWGIIF